MIFNTFIERAAWPKTWKRGIWTPVFKKDDRQATSNYRPITVLPVVGKIYEKLLSKQITGFANFIDEWSRCDFCFTNFGVIL